MAARTESRKFGTFTLTESANGIHLERWSNTDQIKLNSTSRHSGTGSLRQSRKEDGVLIRLSGGITGTDTGDLATNVDAFRTAFYNGPDYLQLYSDRRILCELAKDLRLDLVKGPEGRAWRFQADLMALATTWEGVTPFSDDNSESGAGPYTLTLTTDTGDADAYPTITIEDTGSGWSDKELTLTNNNTSRQFKMAALSLQSGDSIVIDMLEGTIGDGAGTPVTPGVISGAPFPLTPGVSNVILVEHTIGAGASMDINVSWRPQFRFL